MYCQCHIFERVKPMTFVKMQLEFCIQNYKSLWAFLMDVRPLYSSIGTLNISIYDASFNNHDTCCWNDLLLEWLVAVFKYIIVIVLMWNYRVCFLLKFIRLQELTALFFIYFSSTKVFLQITIKHFKYIISHSWCAFNCFKIQSAHTWHRKYQSEITR